MVRHSRYTSIYSPLGLERPSMMKRDNFVVGDSNREAFSLVDSWGEDSSNYDRGGLIVGAVASGKTHLCCIWSEKMGEVHYLSGVGFSSLSISEMLRIDKPVIVDSVDLWSDEETFLHRYNILVERKIPLLMTSTKKISEWDISLPDLKSRMSLLRVAVIKVPDDEVLRGVLKKHLKDIGITLPDHIQTYIFSRIERSFSAIFDLCQYLDKVSIEEGRSINLSFVREALEAVSK